MPKANSRARIALLERDCDRIDRSRKPTLFLA